MNNKLVDLTLTKLSTAILAYEKGFTCAGWSVFMYDAKFHEDTNDWEIESYEGRIPDEYWYSQFRIAPQPLLQKWLRDKHNIDVEAYAYYEKRGDKINYKIYHYGYSYICDDELFEDISIMSYKTYEEALEQGLVEALNLITK